MMAFMKINDLRGILTLVVLSLPSIAANIDCNGKPFHCVNSTHFMICVDLGSGVSSTIDDFVIPCPPTTVCQGTNRFECDFPEVTTTTVAPQVISVSETIGTETTPFYDVTTSIPFEEYFNTLSTTTVSEDVLVVQPAIVTESILPVTGSEAEDNIILHGSESNTTSRVTNPSATDTVQNDLTAYTLLPNYVSAVVPAPSPDITENSNVIISGSESNSTLIITVPSATDVVKNNFAPLNTSNSTGLPINVVDINTEPILTIVSETTTSVSIDVAQSYLTTLYSPSNTAVPNNTVNIVTESTVNEVPESIKVKHYESNSTSATSGNILLNYPKINDASSETIPSVTVAENDIIISYIPSSKSSNNVVDIVTELIVTDVMDNVNVLNPESNKTLSGTHASVDVEQNYPTLNISSSTAIGTEANIINVTGNINVIKHDPELNSALGKTVSSYSIDIVQNKLTTPNTSSSATLPNNYIVTEPSSNNALPNKAEPVTANNVVINTLVNELNQANTTGNYDSSVIDSNNTTEVITQSSAEMTSTVYHSSSTISTVNSNSNITTYVIDTTPNSIIENTVPTQEVDSITYSNMYQYHHTDTNNIGNDQGILTNENDGKAVLTEKVLSTSIIDNTASTSKFTVMENETLLTGSTLSVTDVPVPETLIEVTPSLTTDIVPGSMTLINNRTLMGDSDPLTTIISVNDRKSTAMNDTNNLLITNITVDSSTVSSIDISSAGTINTVIIENLDGFTTTVPTTLASTFANTETSQVFSSEPSNVVSTSEVSLTETAYLTPGIFPNRITINKNSDLTSQNLPKAATISTPSTTAKGSLNSLGLNESINFDTKPIKKVDTESTTRTAGGNEISYKIDIDPPRNVDGVNSKSDNVAATAPTNTSLLPVDHPHSKTLSVSDIIPGLTTSASIVGDPGFDTATVANQKQKSTSYVNTTQEEISNIIAQELVTHPTQTEIPLKNSTTVEVITDTSEFSTGSLGNTLVTNILEPDNSETSTNGTHFIRVDQLTTILSVDDTKNIIADSSTISFVNINSAGDNKEPVITKNVGGFITTEQTTFVTSFNITETSQMFSSEPSNVVTTSEVPLTESTYLTLDILQNPVTVNEISDPTLHDFPKGAATIATTSKTTLDSSSDLSEFTDIDKNSIKKVDAEIITNYKKRGGDGIINNGLQKAFISEKIDKNYNTSPASENHPVIMNEEPPLLAVNTENITVPFTESSVPVFYPTTEVISTEVTNNSNNDPTLNVDGVKSKSHKVVASTPANMNLLSVGNLQSKILLDSDIIPGITTSASIIGHPGLELATVANQKKKSTNYLNTTKEQTSKTIATIEVVAETPKFSAGYLSNTLVTNILEAENSETSSKAIFSVDDTQSTAVNDEKQLVTTNIIVDLSTTSFVDTNSADDTKKPIIIQNVSGFTTTEQTKIATSFTITETSQMLSSNIVTTFEVPLTESAYSTPDILQNPLTINEVSEPTLKDFPKEAATVATTSIITENASSYLSVLMNNDDNSIKEVDAGIIRTAGGDEIINNGLQKAFISEKTDKNNYTRPEKQNHPVILNEEPPLTVNTENTTVSHTESYMPVFYPTTEVISTEVANNTSASYDIEALKEKNILVNLLLNSIRIPYREITVTANTKPIQEETVPATSTNVNGVSEKPRISTQIQTLKENKMFLGSMQNENYTESTTVAIIETTPTNENFSHGILGIPVNIHKSTINVPNVLTTTTQETTVNDNRHIETLKKEPSQANQVLDLLQAGQLPNGYFGSISIPQDITTGTQKNALQETAQIKPTILTIISQPQIKASKVDYDSKSILQNQQNVVQLASTPWINNSENKSTNGKVTAHGISKNTGKTQEELPNKPKTGIIKNKTLIPEQYGTVAIEVQGAETNILKSNSQIQVKIIKPSQDTKIVEPQWYQGVSTGSPIKNSQNPLAATNQDSDPLIITWPITESQRSIGVTKSPIQITNPIPLHKQSLIDVTSTGPNSKILNQIPHNSVIYKQTARPNFDHMISGSDTEFINFPHVKINNEQLSIDETSTASTTKSWNKIPQPSKTYIETANSPIFNSVASTPKVELINVPKNSPILDPSDTDVIMVDVIKPTQTTVLRENTDGSTDSGISVIPKPPKYSVLEQSEQLEASESVEKPERQEGKEKPESPEENPESNKGEQNEDTPAIDTTYLKFDSGLEFNKNTEASRFTNKIKLHSTIEMTTVKVKEHSDTGYQSFANIQQLSSIMKLSNVNSAHAKVANVVSPKDKLVINESIVTAHIASNTTANTKNSTARFNPQTKTSFANTHNTSGPAFESDSNSHNFVCKLNSRGRVPDSKDCRKFYICIGKPEPIEGICPNNTVFSELRKQCTKNLSHCVRNHQFQCISEGRFSDYLNDSIYYICVKNNVGTFIRFKLQCQNGYHLNKTSVRCELNTESSQSTSQQSTGDISKNNSDQSVSSAKSEKLVVEPSKPKKFECKKEGKFPDTTDCRKYYICTKIGKSQYRQKCKKCDSDELFHKDKKKCVDADSYECS